MRVACAIIVRRGRILAARRGAEGARAWRWEFPGGKLHPGETAADCVVREIREELAIEIEPLEVLPAVKYRYPDLAIELIPVVCRYRSGRIQRREHAATRWISPGEATRLDWCAADREIVTSTTANPVSRKMNTR